MNRNEEYNTLLAELEITPPELEHTVARAQARQKKVRRRRAVLAPIGSFAAVFAAFALTVNLSPNFAQAVSGIPFLSDLAEFVSFSPSLSAAVENEYVQQIGQEQAENGITARVEYIIVDYRQLNIFYTLDSELYTDMDAYAGLESSDGTELQGLSTSSSHYPGMENGVLRKVTVDSPTGKMPESFILALNVFLGEQAGQSASARPLEEEKSEQDNTGPEYISHFKFPIAIDLSRIAEGEILEMNREFVLGGQKIILESAEIYPTHMRVNFGASEENSAWLSRLSFYITNEKGEVFEGVSSGVSAFGSVDSPMQNIYLFESPYFSLSENLSLHITAAAWLDKGKETIRVDLANKTADFLPEGVSFETCERDGEDWILTFLAPERKDLVNNWVWSWNYYDAEGSPYTLSGMGGGPAYEKAGSTQMLILENYPYDEVWLVPNFTSRFEYGEPVTIEIK